MEDRIASLEASVQALTGQVQQLRQELATRRGHGAPRMRRDAECPACGCRKVLLAHKVQDDNGSGRAPMQLWRKSLWFNHVVGQFQVYICTSCFCCEWYVKDLADLDLERDEFELIDATDNAQPGVYR